MEEAILSVGIDIGTTTTQMVLSRIVFLNHHNPFYIPEYKILSKEIIYYGTIYRTPLIDDNLLDIKKIADLIDEEYKIAGISRGDIDTGAVIITGDTARKENAEAVLHGISDFAGDFVVATVGSTLESVISGKGAGADKRSKQCKGATANLDIGGGTTNISVFESGNLIATLCINAGGALICFLPEVNEVSYVSPFYQKILNQRHHFVKKGCILSETEIYEIADEMAEDIYQGILILEREYENIKSLSFSGGVSDILIALDTRSMDYRDMGLYLAKAIRKSRLYEKYEIVSSTETIRATVIGAGSHTTEISGSTIHIKNMNLPIKNYKVISVDAKFPDNLGNKLFSTIEEMNQENDIKDIMLYLIFGENVSFYSLQEIAKEIIIGTKAWIEQKTPFVFAVNRDLAKALGQTLSSLLGDAYPILCIDGIFCTDDDFVDIGRPLAGGSVVPVIVKSLIWN